MSQPAPKQSIWQILLFATVVFLAFNLFFMPKQSDPRTADQIMQSIRSQAQTIKNRAAQEHRSIHDIITELDNGSTAKSGKIDLQIAFDQLNADQDLEQMRLLNELVLDQSIVGVNKYVMHDEPQDVPTLVIDETVGHHQVERLEQTRTRRDKGAVAKALDSVRRAAQRSENTMPATIEAVRAYATLGEICSALRDVYGIYEEPAI